jgi:hypothetical protein
MVIARVTTELIKKIAASILCEMEVGFFKKCLKFIKSRNENVS